VSYTVTDVPLLCAVFGLALIALYGMGMMFASLFLLFGREGWHIVNLVQEPVYLISGTYFPITGLNIWVAAGASIIPLTLALDAMRQLAFAGGEPGLLPPPVEAGVLAGLSVVFVYCAYRLLAYMETRAIKEGTLTESRA
jgi:ABC-2 type transport system permease protein